jgi:hypothetical protein
VTAINPAFGRALVGVLSFGLLTNIAAAQNPVGVFDAQTDVGQVKHAGSASYDRRLQAYAITGSGQNIWGDHDDFHFVWKRMTGNFILSTRAHFVGKGVEAHRKIGWMIRPSLETNAPQVSAALHGDGLASLQFRRTAGATTEESKSALSLPNADAVIQLERRDGVYVMSIARFGDTLATRELTGVSLPDTVYVGLFVCAHNDSVVERAEFSNVRITTPPAATFVPYRDYLGSNLEILDVASGNTTIVHQYKGSFQAPNWTNDGKALIYAQEGHLYRFDIASQSVDVINTAFATHNNNDHVLSFDGRMLAISNNTPEDSGASIVYTVPTAGGTPKRITAKGPSYLHGWSPMDAGWCSLANATTTSTFTGFPPPAVMRSGSRRRPGWTTGRSTLRTASTSTSARFAADECKSGGCDQTEPVRHKSRTTDSTTGSRTSRPMASRWCSSPSRCQSRRTIIHSTST